MIFCQTLLLDSEDGEKIKDVEKIQHSKSCKHFTRVSSHLSEIQAQVKQGYFRLSLWENHVQNLSYIMLIFSTSS